MSKNNKTLQFTGAALPDEHKARFEKLGFNVRIERPNMDEDELIASLHDVDAHILCGAEKFTQRVLDSAPRLKVIAFFGIGYESYIDAEAATANGIAVTNAPGANSQSVAEFTATLMLDAVKRTPQLTQDTKDGVWQKEVCWDLNGRTLGIIGMGEVGTKLAKIAHFGFGMNIVYSGRSRKPNAESQYNAKFCSLDELLTCSDIVSLNTIETNETKGMIGAKELGLMQSHAVLVNTARPNLVDLEALYNALVDKQIACAAFDCYYQEPAPSPDQDKYGLLRLPNSQFILTPHAGFFSKDAALNTSEMALTNIQAVFEGGQIPNLVNPDFSKHASEISS